MDAQDRRQSDSQVIERLARMEEQLKQVNAIKQSIDQLTTTLANLNNVYLPRSESQALNLAREQQLKNLEEKLTNQDKRITKLENAGSWVVKIVGGILIAALISLVIIKGGNVK